tara:strand:+ start:401 stop:955 length:555 start_codon:yes stop_codon:yes gene_type:complete
MSKNKIKFSQLFDQLSTNGGFTINLNGNKVKSSGFVCSVNGKSLNCTDLFETMSLDQFEAIVLGFVAANSYLLAQPDNNLGGWIHEGKLCLDVSEVIEEQLMAYAHCRNLGELAYYNLQTGKDVDCMAPLEAQIFNTVDGAMFRMHQHQSFHNLGFMSNECFMAVATSHKARILDVNEVNSIIN